MKTIKISDVFLENGYVYVRPISGTYEHIYRAAKGVYWDNDKGCLFYKGFVSKEDALRFVFEAMQQEYGITLIYC